MNWKTMVVPSEMCLCTDPERCRDDGDKWANLKDIQEEKSTQIWEQNVDVNFISLHTLDA